MTHIILKEERTYSRRSLEEKFGGKLAQVLSEFGENMPAAVKFDKENGYGFSAVGLIILNGTVIKCYPKYWKEYDEGRFKQLLKVIERYNRSDVNNLFNEPFSEFEGRFDPLSMILYLLRDYYENGVYSNEHNIIEINGLGEILWDKTVNEQTALISRGRPFYPEMFTKKHVDDEYDYIKRLHKCVLTKCSGELQENGLLSLFDLDAVELSDEELSDFGDAGYILDRLQKELNVQFNTQKQIVLKALYTYISEDKHLSECNVQTRYMVTKFHTVWEHVCKTVFNDRLDISVSKLAWQTPKKTLDADLEHFKNSSLIQIIDKPFWSGFNKYADKSPEPDIVCFWDKTFAILDAKYYVPEKGLPGVQDITKQYLYQLALRKFYTLQGFSEIKNCFLLPENGDEVADFGYVEIKFIKELLLVTKDANGLREDNIQLENIQVRGVPADELYSLYLRGQSRSVDYLKLK